MSPERGELRQPAVHSSSSGSPSQELGARSLQKALAVGGFTPASSRGGGRGQSLVVLDRWSEPRGSGPVVRASWFWTSGQSLMVLDQWSEWFWTSGQSIVVLDQWLEPHGSGPVVRASCSGPGVRASWFWTSGQSLMVLDQWSEWLWTSAEGRSPTASKQLLTEVALVCRQLNHDTGVPPHSVSLSSELLTAGPGPDCCVRLRYPESSLIRPAPPQ
ncbi:unnamed protein product [Gadus morhua 'NCC']